MELGNQLVYPWCERSIAGRFAYLSFLSFFFEGKQKRRARKKGRQNKESERQEMKKNPLQNQKNFISMCAHWNVSNPLLTRLIISLIEILTNVHKIIGILLFCCCYFLYPNKLTLSPSTK